MRRLLGLLALIVVGVLIGFFVRLIVPRREPTVRSVYEPPVPLPADTPHATGSDRPTG